MIDVKIKKIYGDAQIPKYGSEFAAGADLYAENVRCDCDSNIPDDGLIHIPPHTTVKIGTGIATELPEGYCALILARSGLATKKGLAPANKVGLVDNDYRGEYIVALHNHTDKEQTIEFGERVAQVMFVPYVQANFIVTEELEDTDRGVGGFGSSGTK